LSFYISPWNVVLWIFDDLITAWKFAPGWVIIGESSLRSYSRVTALISPSIPTVISGGCMALPESRYPEDTQSRFGEFLDLLLYLSDNEDNITPTESFENFLKLIPDLRKPFDASQWDLFWSDSLRTWFSGMSQVIMKTNF
jgi:hypothetical protein